MLLCPSTHCEQRKLSAENAELKRRDLLASMTRGRGYSWVHPNFYHDHIFPIGVTWSHAFVVSYVKEARKYHLHALCLNSQIDTPYLAMRGNRQFSNPWKRWPGELSPIQAACCYLGRVCLITKKSVLVLDASKDWEVVLKVTLEDLQNIGGCSMNHRYLAFYSNSETNSRLVVYSFEEKRTFSVSINSARATSAHVPEEMTARCADDIYFGFVKADGTTPTCVFRTKEDNLELQKKFVAWPTNKNQTPIVSEGPDLIYYRFSNFLQAASKTLCCFYSENKNNSIFLPTRNKVICAQPVAHSALVVFQGDCSLLLTDSHYHFNMCLEPSEICGPCGIASLQRLQGVPEYTRCYPAFKVMTERIVLLLPNGSLCSIVGQSSAPERPLASQEASSSYSSSLAAVDDDDEERE